jgi:formamidopyrimidine-DNA glycosylase
MPELPDVTVYVERLQAMFGGHVLTGVRVRSPSLLRTAVPPLSSVSGRKALEFSRLGKRIVTRLEGDLFLVLHLMIAGRLHVKPVGHSGTGRIDQAVFDFDHASLLLTEASSHKRAQLYVHDSLEAAQAHDRGGMEVLGSKLKAFAEVLRSENHTVKRSLTDPRLLSGIGNAYSDEILHHAKMSPVKMTKSLTDADIKTLHKSSIAMLELWTERMREEVGDGFPEKVTAFRPQMAVHGKYGKPCPVCGTKVQRIAYASNETNYCPTCQTEGKLLADRGLSRLLKQDWPKTLEELEEHKAARKPAVTK